MTRPQPYTVQVLQDLHKNGELPEVAELWVEPSFGVVAHARYTNGSVRMVHVNDIGANAAAAVSLVKDKGHTRRLLHQFGYNHPTGMDVLLPWWATRLGITPDSAVAASFPEAGVSFAAELGFPVYVKSAHGSLGRSVWRCDDEADVAAAFDRCAKRRVRVAVVEQAIDMPDYRLFVLDGEVPIAYERMPLTVTGDGQHSIAELFAQVRASAREQGRDVQIDVDDDRVLRCLRRECLSVDSVPHRGRRIRLLDVSNLSTGGMLRDVSDEIGPQWVELAANIARDFGLRCCGVDIAAADISGPVGDYAILELNGTPGLDHYASGSATRDARARHVLAGVFAHPPVVVG
jgi:hypothetical protein